MRDIRELPIDKVMLSPSLLAADFSRLGEEIAAAAAAGADMLHLDVMDGHLVPNLSFGQPVLKSLRSRSELLFDTHLMIEEPARYAATFAAAGADHLTFHVESKEEPETVIRAIREAGCTVGMSLRPGTPAEALFPYLEAIDLVLVMTVEPGFGGQSFMADQLPKITAFKREIDRRGLHVQLEVDGGVDALTAPRVIAAGANLLVAGTAFFRHPRGMAAAVEELRDRHNHDGGRA